MSVTQIYGRLSCECCYVRTIWRYRVWTMLNSWLGLDYPQLGRLLVISSSWSFTKISIVITNITKKKAIVWPVIDRLEKKLYLIHHARDKFLQPFTITIHKFICKLLMIETKVAYKKLSHLNFNSIKRLHSKYLARLTVPQIRMQITNGTLL